MKGLLVVALALIVGSGGGATANVAPPWTLVRTKRVPAALTEWFSAASAAMAAKDMGAAKKLCDSRAFSRRRATRTSQTLEELFAEGIEKGLGLRADLTEAWTTGMQLGFIVKASLQDAKHEKVERVVYLYLQGERDLQEKTHWTALWVSQTLFDSANLVRRFHETAGHIDRLD